MSSHELPVFCQYLVMSSAAFLNDVTQMFIDLLGLDDTWCVAAASFCQHLDFRYLFVFPLTRFVFQIVRYNHLSI